MSQGEVTVGAHPRAAVLGAPTDTPTPMGTAPTPAVGVVSVAEHSSSESPQSSPGRGSLPILGVPKATPARGAGTVTSPGRRQAGAGAGE